MPDNQPGKLFVGGINPNWSEREVEAAFSKYGKIENVFLGRDRETGACRGFCYIKFEDTRDAEECIEALDKTEMNGKELRVEHAFHAPQRDDGGYSRGGYTPRGRGDYRGRGSYRGSFQRHGSPGAGRGRGYQRYGSPEPYRRNDYQPRGRGGYRGRGSYSRGGYRDSGDSSYYDRRGGRDSYAPRNSGYGRGERFEMDSRPRRYSPSPSPPRDFRDREFGGPPRSGPRPAPRTWDRDEGARNPRPDYGGRGYDRNDYPDIPPRSSRMDDFGAPGPNYGGRSYGDRDLSPPPMRAPRGPRTDSPPPFRGPREAPGAFSRGPPRDYGLKRGYESAPRDAPKRDYGAPMRTERPYARDGPIPMKRHRMDDMDRMPRR